MYHRFFIPFICSQELWWFQIQHLETYPVALSLSDWSCLYPSLPTATVLLGKVSKGALQQPLGRAGPS